MGVQAVVLRHDQDQEMKGVYKILHFAIFAAAASEPEASEPEAS